MTGEGKFGMACSEFETLLTEALDGTLAAAEMDRFRGHAAACAECGPMFAQAQLGMQMLAGLDEVEPPHNLVRNILAITSGREPLHREVARSWGERLSEWGIPAKIRGALVPVYATVRQPRFAMSFGMVFFSFAMTMTIFGVKLSSIQHIDLRPSAIRVAVTSGYYQTTAKLVRYYDNMRFVMEMRSRMRELQGEEENQPQAQPQPQDQRPQEQQQKRQNDNNTSGQPGNDRNYSQEMQEQTVAGAVTTRELMHLLTRR